MCFVRPSKTGLAVIVGTNVVIVEARNRVGAMLSSRKREPIQLNSAAPFATTLYLDSVVEQDITFCFVEDHKMMLEPINTK